MDYKETLEWLFSQLPMYQRDGQSAYKADLKTTEDLLEILGDPQKKFKAIHVAGTNGKGSVSHLIASILTEAGYKTGLYTSPHLKDFRERIKINGVMIDEAFVVEFVQAHQREFEKIKPSFFEMTVAMAFDYFVREKVDVAVVEVGMGGRLDSTNLVEPVVSVITNIGLDHTKFLGDTLEKIASEKAGIIKKEVPVVIGKRQPETEPVFHSAAKANETVLHYAEDHYDIKLLNSLEPNKQKMDIWRDNEVFLEDVDSGLLGRYQKENIATALQAAELIKEKGFRVENDHIRDGLEYIKKNTGFIGRWHVLDLNPLTVCDTAHNQDGIKAVLEQMDDLTFDKLHFVLGMVNDKDVDGILSLLPTQATYYFCKPDIPRGLDAEILQKRAETFGLKGLFYNSVERAFSSAYNNARPLDLVFVGGSTFVVAEII